MGQKHHNEGQEAASQDKHDNPYREPGVLDGAFAALTGGLGDDREEMQDRHDSWQQGHDNASKK